MQGVTTAIVAFIFVAMWKPSLIRHRTYFFTAFIVVLLAILLDAIEHMSGHPVIYLVEALSQIAAIVLAVCSVGGLTLGEFKSEIGQTIEVIRRGETTKEVLVPLSDAAYRAGRASQAAGHRQQDDATPQVFTIDDPPARQAPAAKPRNEGPLPLD